MSAFTRRVMWALLSLLLLVSLGTSGYMVMEGQRFQDSLYMTVITLTAVGYREVWSLSPEGRGITIFILMAGITWLGFWFAIVTSMIVELDLRGAMRIRREIREIDRMKNHVIVCGVGRTGNQVVKELEGVGAPYVVVERDADRVARIHDQFPNSHVVEGDATHDDVLLSAGLTRAAGLISCLSADADNLYVALSARDLVADVRIVARANEEESIDKLYRAGADQVVSPNISGAVRMASGVLRPSVVSFVDIATKAEHVALRMEQLSVHEGSQVANKTLAEARIPKATGLVVIAIHKIQSPTEDFVFNPSADTELEVGDEIIVLGGDAQLEKLRSYLS